MDLDKYINYLVATTLVQHWDCFNKNHLMAFNPADQKWFVVPWDLDRTFGDHSRGGFNQAQFLSLGHAQPSRPDRLESDGGPLLLRPNPQEQIHAATPRSSRSGFTPAKLFPLLDEMEAHIREEAAMDRARWPAPVRSLQTGIAGVKSYIERRRTYLLGELATFEEQSPAQSKAIP